MCGQKFCGRARIGNHWNRHCNFFAARTAAAITIQQIPVITLFFIGIQNAITTRRQHAVAATGRIANIGILFSCIT
jgi:hypothetical protein